jgi:hypothetical protein
MTTFCPVQVEAMSVVRDPQGDGARRAHDGHLGLRRPAVARGVAECFLDDAKELLSAAAGSVRSRGAER